MKRAISLLLAAVMLLSLTGCSGAGIGSKYDEILDLLQQIQATVDSIPPSLFQTEESDESGSGIVYIAEDSDFRRKTRPGTLTVGMVRTKESFDPCGSSFVTGMSLLYDPLFAVDPDGEIRGVLAESWEFTDETHLTIKLREATFSNGDAVTAEDCIWSLQRFAESDSRWHHLFDFMDFENSTVTSDNEFVLAMTEENGICLPYLASYFACILDKDYIASAGDEAFAEAPVGSGPYSLAEGESESEYVFERREDYWDEDSLPDARTIRIRIYDDSASMMSEYESGDLDMAFSVDAVDAERLLSGEIIDTSYMIVPEHDVCSLVLPEHVEAFDDIRVRRAIALAVDWNNVRECGYGVLCQEADSLVPNSVPYKESLGGYEYDPDAAMVLLEEAGYDFGQSYEFVIDNSRASIHTAKTIQHDLMCVGINVHISVYSKAEAEKRCKAGETDFMLSRLGCPAVDPDQVFDASASWSDIASVRISEEPLPTYLNTGRWSADDSIREESYCNAQEWMYESHRQISFAEIWGACCFRPYIDPDFKYDSSGMPDLRLVHFS